jgi:hypothetical protein
MAVAMMISMCGTWHMEDLPRINEIGVLDTVRPCKLIKAAPHLGCDPAQRVAWLDCDLPGTSTLRRGFPLAVLAGPAEAALVVLENLVEADAAGLVWSVHTPAWGAEHVLAVGIEPDVAGRTAEAACVMDTGRWVMGFLMHPLLLLPPPLLLPLALLLYSLLLLLLLVAPVLPILDSVLELVACNGTG